MTRKRMFTAAALLALTCASPALAGELTVTLTDVRPDAGDLYVALQTEDQFLQAAGIAEEIVENPQESTVTVTLTDVPDGTYSLSVWHDIDGDGTFSMGPMGPVDGWTMKGASELRGMPTWEAQSFTVEGATTLTETVLYPRDGE